MERGAGRAEELRAELAVCVCGGRADGVRTSGFALSDAGALAGS